MDKTPFTKEEKEIMDLLIDAHNKFVKLKSCHPMEAKEWVEAFHKLQDLLGHRVLKRDYPNYFK